jgi:hypothetical protein
MSMKTSIRNIFFGAVSIITMVMIVGVVYAGTAHGRTPRAKFYDFSDQLIDGEIKKPHGIYTDSRSNVKFSRLLKLKKSFLGKLYQTSKEKVFK